MTRLIGSSPRPAGVRDDRPWSPPRCESLGFQRSFVIRRERVAPRAPRPL